MTLSEPSGVLGRVCVTSGSAEREDDQHLALRREGASRESPFVLVEQLECSIWVPCAHGAVSSSDEAHLFL